MGYGCAPMRLRITVNGYDCSKGYRINELFLPDFLNAFCVTDRSAEAPPFVVTLGYGDGGIFCSKIHSREECFNEHRCFV